MACMSYIRYGNMMKRLGEGASFSLGLSHLGLNEHLCMNAAKEKPLMSDGLDAEGVDLGTIIVLSIPLHHLVTFSLAYDGQSEGFSEAHSGMNGVFLALS